MALMNVSLLLLFALFFPTNGYDLIFKNISLPDDSKDKFECTFEAYKGTEESECGSGELDTDGQRNEGLDWVKDKLCIKVQCNGRENESQFAIRLQQCELVNIKRPDSPMKKPIHLIDSNGCLAGNAKGQWPKLIPPLNYSYEGHSVEMHGWTFSNESAIDHFPDEATLSCEVQICANLCEQTCLDKLSLDKCSLNDFIGDKETKNMTELCNGANVIGGALNFYLMTLLLLFSCTILMFQ